MSDIDRGPEGGGTEGRARKAGELVKGKRNGQVIG